MTRREVNLAGGFYKDASLPWSAQDTVNWLPQPAQEAGARSEMKLRSVPGLRSLTQSVVPLPQWTTWDPQDIIGSGQLENGNRTFFGVGAAQAAAPNDATTGYKRTRGKDPAPSGARYYFEAYSDLDTLTFNEWPPESEQFAIRLGLARKQFAIGQGAGGNDPLLYEVIWKRDSALGLKSGRGTLYTAGSTGMLAGPTLVQQSRWIGIAVEVSVVSTVTNVRSWVIIDGNWAYEGQNPQNTPGGSTPLVGSFSESSTFGGIVPVCSLYNPRSVNPEFVVRANFGQEPFRIGAAAFQVGGVLDGFTKGWPAE